MGGVLRGSPAERAGLREGDRVGAIDGAPVWRWLDLEETLAAPGEAPAVLEVERDGKTFQVTLERAASASDDDKQGALADLGLSWHAPPAIVGVTDPAGPAAQAGLQDGDRIVAVNAQPVEHLYALQRPLTSVS